MRKVYAISQNFLTQGQMCNSLTKSYHCVTEDCTANAVNGVKTLCGNQIYRISLMFVVYYHPQIKFVKVMFLHLSVSHSVHRGEYLGRYPLDRHPLGKYTPWAGTPPGQVHPLAGTPHGQVHTPQQCMLGYGQQADGTHPTGMHSCSLIFFACLLFFFHFRLV